jgi:hypothetical protein
VYAAAEKSVKHIGVHHDQEGFLLVIPVET